MVAGWHLAQLNIARARTPLDDPLLADFMAQLDAINALAERSRGFVWRLQSDSGNATDIRAFDDPRMIVNLSVWESVEALSVFTYRTPHTGVMARRREWFERLDGPHLVLWWIAGGRCRTSPRRRTGWRISPATGRANMPSPSGNASPRPWNGRKAPPEPCC